MGSVNVNRSVSDQFYRYKMPRLIAKVEGKGNGIKTVIANMVEIGKSLNRPPTYPTKYFGCELGAQTQFDFKNDRFIVNGSHDAHKLQSLLDGFIKKFVLCPECDNPETKLLVNQKKQSINQHCIACGYQGVVDMRHKLTTFIVKNPPGQAPAAVGASLTAAKEKGKSKRKGDKSKKNGDADGSRGDDGSDGDFGSADKDGSDDFDDDWGEDTSEDAVAKRMEDLSNGAKGMTLNDDMEKTQQERLDIFYEFVKKRKADGKVDDLDKEIVAEAERLDIRDKALLVLSELLFDERMLQQVKQHRILFLRFTHGSHKAQKYLLGGFEQLVKMYRDTLIPKVPHILKAFYDLDVLEEEVVIDWAKKVSKKYVSKELSQEIRDKAAPFIKWLQEAEEEDSEEEDAQEEDNVEIVYTDRGLPAARPVAPAEAPKVISSSGNDEDLDIDAI